MAFKSIIQFIKNIESRIIFNGNEFKDLDKYPPYKRPFGIMFQNPILFEHLTVEENLDFVIKRKQLITQNKGKITKELTGSELTEDKLVKYSQG